MTDISKEFLAPFIESAVNTIKTMAQTECTPGEAYVKGDIEAWGEVTGVIGMNSANATGSFAISFDKGSVLEIISKMFMEEITEINSDVLDAVGELTNIISGGTKSFFSAKGFAFEMAIPFVMHGSKIEMKSMIKSTVAGIPITTPKGKFVIEVSFRKE